MSTPNPFIEALAALAKAQYQVENVVYRQKVVNLDGYTFRNCAFFGCQLTTSNGNFALERCFLAAGTTLNFAGNALRTVKLATLLPWDRVVPGLRAVSHTDGTVTIK